MKSGIRKIGTVFVAATLAASTISVAIAQGPGGPGGPGGQGRRMGPRMGRSMGQNQEITAVNAPLQPLEKALKLTADQTQKILDIQQNFHQAVRDILPSPPRTGGDPPDRSAVKASAEKLKALDTKYSAKVEAVLTTDQKAALKAYLADNNDFRIVGIPPEVAPQLKLTAAQRAKVQSIAEKARTTIHDAMDQSSKGTDANADREAIDKAMRTAHEAVLEILTDEQETILTKMGGRRRGGAMGGRGGPDGMGGPGMRGPGGMDGQRGGPDGGRMEPQRGGPDAGPMGPEQGGPDGGPMGPELGGPDAGPMGPEQGGPDGGPMGPPTGAGDGSPMSITPDLGPEF